MFIGDFYSYILILTNNFIFLLLFLKHLIDIKLYFKKLLKKYSWSKDTKHTEVSSICYEIMWIRNEIENSIDKLEPLFVSNTLLVQYVRFIISNNSITIYKCFFDLLVYITNYIFTIFIL